MVVGNHCADHVTPLYPQKLALTSPTGGSRCVGIVRSRIKAMEFNVWPESMVFPHTCLWYIQLVASLTFRLPWTLQISLLDMMCYALVFGWSELFPLEMRSLSVDFSYRCLIDFTVRG
jgi:hypothetical protein